MWWFELTYVEDEPNLLVSYFHINPITKVLEVNKKLAKNEEEFIKYYEEIKSL